MEVSEILANFNQLIEYLCSLTTNLNIKIMYPPELVKPMREELTNIGFTELHTQQNVTDALSKEGTTLVVVNSVCGMKNNNFPFFTVLK